MSTILRITIPAGEAKMTPPLGVILGQHQLPGAKICLEFNKQTSTTLAGVPIRTEIKKLPQNNFEIKIKTPPLPFLILQQFLTVNTISLVSLYDVFRFCRLLPEFSTISDEVLANLIFATLKSTRCGEIIF